MSPLPTTGGKRHYVFQSSDYTFIVRPLTPILREVIGLSLILMEISTKLVTSIQHASERCRKDFKVKGRRRSRLLLRGQNALSQWRHTFQWCGIAAHLFKM